MSITKFKVVLSKNPLNPGSIVPVPGYDDDDTQGAPTDPGKGTPPQDQGGDGGENQGDNNSQGQNQNENDGHQGNKETQGNNSEKQGNLISETDNKASQNTETEEAYVASVPDTGNFNRYGDLTSGIAVSGGTFITLLIFFLIIKLNQKSKKSLSFQSKTNNISRKTKHIFFLKSLICLSFVFTLGFIAMFLKETTLAEASYLELPLSAPEEITLDAKILNSEDAAFVKVPVQAMQSYADGYKIYMHASDTKMRSSDGSLVLNTVSEQGVLEDNSFGYSLDNPALDLKTHIFNPVHTEEERDLVFDIDRPVEAGEIFDLYFAVRSSNLKEDTYELDLFFTAIAEKPKASYMQNMNSEVCNSMQEGISYEFIDLRDNKTYTVEKMKDGNCWMTSDLALELVAGDETSDGGTKRINPETGEEEIVALTSENTDLNTKPKFIPNANTLKGDELSQWRDCKDEECLENLSYRKDFDPEEDDMEGTSYYYSFYTATLNSIENLSEEDYEQADMDPSSVSLPDSICPRGWSIPTLATIMNYGEAYGNNPSAIYNAYKPTLNGMIERDKGDDFELRAEGRSQLTWINALDGDSEAYSLIFDSKDDYYSEVEDINMKEGINVRCIANLTSSVIEFDQNTEDNSVSGVPKSPIIATPSEGSKDIFYTVPDSVPTRDGYQFGGWSVSSSSAPTIFPGEAKKASSAYIKLYATWYKETGITMQEMDAEYCANNITEGGLYLFTDNRDGKAYIVSKYKDGNCWMVSNLDLDLVASDGDTDGGTKRINPETGTEEIVSLTPENTDVIRNYSPNMSTSAEDGIEWSYDGYDEHDPFSYPQYSFDSGRQSDGNYYNILAATAGAQLDDGVEEIESFNYSICPKGWKLPSINHYASLISSYGYRVDGDDQEYRENIPYLLDQRVGIYRSGENDKYGAGITHYGYTSAYHTNSGEDHHFIISEDKGLELYFDDDFDLDGTSIRCYATYNTATLDYSSNISSSNLPESASLTVENGIIETSVSSTILTSEENYQFAGWATSPNGQLAYKPGDTIILASPHQTLYAVWYEKINATMQSMTAEVCDNLTVNSQYMINDERDNKYYTITHLEDGSCWMTSNLALDLVANGGAKKTNPETGEEEIVALTSENTDLASGSWSPSHSTETELSSNWDCDSEENCHKSATYSYENNDKYYYTWYTATASSLSRQDFENGAHIASDSICPKGWYLPTYQEYDKLENLFHSKKNLVLPPLSFQNVGNRSPYGYIDDYRSTYWSKSITSSNEPSGMMAYNDYAYDTTDGGEIRSGNPIRCIFDHPTSSTISFYTEDNNYNTRVITTIEATGNHGEVSFNIPSDIDIPARDGYTFKGWSLQDDRSNKVYQQGDTVTTGSGNIVLYASWRQIPKISIYCDRECAEPYTNQYIQPTGYDETTGVATFTLPEEPPVSNGHYEFDYYEHDGKTYQPGETVQLEFSEYETEKTFYPHWRSLPSDTVTVKFVSYRDDVEQDTLPEPIVVTKYECEGYGNEYCITFTIPEQIPVLQGFNFINWDGNERGQEVTFGVDKDQYELIFGARWSRIPESYDFTIYFENYDSDVSGSLPSPISTTKTNCDEWNCNISFEIPETDLLREGYKLAGYSTWSGAEYPEHSPGVNFRSIQYYENSLTLYPVWKRMASEPTLTVHFDDNNDENIAVPSEIKDVEKQPNGDSWYVSFYIDGQQPIRNNYTFMGWNTDKDASWVQCSMYSYCSLYDNIEESQTDLTLYAVWEYVEPTSLPFHVVFDSNANGDSVNYMPGDYYGTLNYDNEKSKYYITLNIQGEKGYTPERYNYELVGFNTDSTSQNAICYINSDCFLEFSEYQYDLTLYAIWTYIGGESEPEPEPEPTYVTVHFSSNSGNEPVVYIPGPQSEIMQYEDGQYYIRFYIGRLYEHIPDRSEAYTFLGYNTDSSSTYATCQLDDYCTIYLKEGDTETWLYAIWQYNGSTPEPEPTETTSPFTIYFNENTSDYVNPDTMPENKQLNAEKICSNGNCTVTFTVPDESPSRANFNFIAWHLDKEIDTSSSGMMEAFNTKTQYTINVAQDAESMTLYAVWEYIGEGILIRFKDNVWEEDIEVPDDIIGEKVYEGDYWYAYVDIPDFTPVRAGYTFRGWSTDQGQYNYSYINCSNVGEVCSFNIDESNTQITLYAVWEEEKGESSDSMTVPLGVVRQSQTKNQSADTAAIMVASLSVALVLVGSAIIVYIEKKNKEEE